ncbi:iron ABC transporter substrate-binding protein [Methanoculleus sp. MH98A]|uniref:iron ABC transporter substrate-binding protein n=1 Tax=Methanoculleus sp. MH98A TaxID=1495314 RepID=UPI000693B378|nr:iron ABC transporter substrate-binding protein [Methanoculleus sp. MH98A]
MLILATCFCGCTGSQTTATRNVTGNEPAGEIVTITDAYGREVTVPVNPTRVVCSGAGCLRLITYLEGSDLVVGVDNIDKADNSYSEKEYNARAYYLAHPEYASLPLIGNHHSDDNPENIVLCNPDVIFRTNGATAALSDEELQEKTGIPVVGLNYGDPTANREALYDSLRLMGTVIGKEDRADEVVAFLEAQIDDLAGRVAGVNPTNPVTVYVAGISSRGPQGFQSTSPTYAPFEYINANRFNVANNPDNPAAQVDVAKEKILDWDPDVIFVELGTVQINPDAIDMMRTDESLRILKAVQNGEVYGLVPYNWYSYNYGTAIISAYYAGTLMYPEQFSDIVIEEKADEIYTFLVGKPVFDDISRRFEGLAYCRITL